MAATMAAIQKIRVTVYQSSKSSEPWKGSSFGSTV